MLNHLLSLTTCLHFQPIKSFVAKFEQHYPPLKTTFHLRNATSKS
jgi:hypothetical protein